jgi:hypothetical protein
MRWHSQFIVDPEWNPASTPRGEHRRIFDDATELGMACYIRLNFTTQNRLFTSEDFHVLAFARYRDAYRNAEAAPRFCCSDAFIHGFMVRHRFSLRREHWKGRSLISPEDVEHSTQRLHDLLEAQNKNLILNCDETAWRVYRENILT